MNNPKENDQYKLFIDSFNYIILSVSFVESNVVWLSSVGSSYKYEEKEDSKNESYAQMYKDAVERYKAVAMKEPIVEASFKCVVDEY